MKLLFLDHDGVMVTPKEFGTRHKTRRRFDTFNNKCIKTLNDIISATDCEICISSDWRNFGTLADLQEHYREMGVYKLPLFVTPILSNSGFNLETTRTLEIMRVVAAKMPTNWVAVDDLNLETLPNFVLCNDSHGIKDIGIKDKILTFL